MTVSGWVVGEKHLVIQQCLGHGNALWMAPRKRLAMLCQQYTSASSSASVTVGRVGVRVDRVRSADSQQRGCAGAPVLRTCPQCLPCCASPCTLTAAAAQRAVWRQRCWNRPAHTCLHALGSHPATQMSTLKVTQCGWKKNPMHMHAGCFGYLRPSRKAHCSHYTTFFTRCCTCDVLYGSERTRTAPRWVWRGNERTKTDKLDPFLDKFETYISEWYKLM